MNIFFPNNLRGIDIKFSSINRQNRQQSIVNSPTNKATDKECDEVQLFHMLFLVNSVDDAANFVLA